jgi:hypothetical protein
MERNETRLATSASMSKSAKLSAVEQHLLDAGITPEVLMGQWGVILWGIKAKEGRIKIKVDPRQPLDSHALERWFEAILGQPVSVKQSSVNNCCQSPCKGCLWFDPEKRAFWGAGTHSSDPD